MHAQRRHGGLTTFWLFMLSGSWHRGSRALFNVGKSIFIRHSSKMRIQHQNQFWSKAERLVQCCGMTNAPSTSFASVIAAAFLWDFVNAHNTTIGVWEAGELVNSGPSIDWESPAFARGRISALLLKGLFEQQLSLEFERAKHWTNISKGVHLLYGRKVRAHW